MGKVKQMILFTGHPEWNEEWLLAALDTEEIRGDVDRLPYTEPFEMICLEYWAKVDPTKTDGDVWEHYVALRKLRATNEMMQRFGRGPRSPCGRVSRGETMLLRSMYEGLGVPLDRMPYTERFQRIYEAVRAQARQYATKNEVWWMLLSKRKTGELGKSRMGQEDA